MDRSRSLFTALLLAVLATPAAGAPPSLTEAVQSAYQRHPDRPLAAASRGEAEALARQADSPWRGNPALALNHQNDAMGSGHGLREWEVGVELPLLLPDQRSARRAVAGALDAQATALARTTRWRVAGEVRQRTWDVALARNRVEHRRREADTARRLLGDIQRAFRAGELARTDLVMAREELLKREARLVDAESSLRRARSRYRSLTGLDGVPPEPFEAMAERPGWKSSHPRLVLAARRLRKARSERGQAVAERGGPPVVTVGGRRERGAAGEAYTNSVGVGLRLPLALQSQSAPAIAASERRITEAQSRRDRARRAQTLAVEEAREATAAARDARKTAFRRAELSAERLHLTRRAFELGETDLFDLLRARDEAFTAARLRDRRRLELGRAIARYNQALGVIPE